MNRLLSKSEQQKIDLLARISLMIRERLTAQDAHNAEKFVQEFYAKVAASDLLDTSDEEAYGSALAFWRFANKRPSEKALVRAYNPTLEEHGWQSDHSVVEICTTDRPFLVDSITAALIEQDLTVYLTIHPVITSYRDTSGKLLGTTQQGAVKPSTWDHSGHNESFMLFQVNRQANAEQLEDLSSRLSHCLEEGDAAVRDWQARWMPPSPN